MRMGTKVKAMRSAPAGIRSSLVSSLSRSAMGCNVPKGPQRLGPIRLWKRPSRRRSIQLTAAAPSSTALTRISIMTTPAIK